MATTKKAATKKKVVAKKAPAAKKTAVKAAPKKAAAPKTVSKKTVPVKKSEPKPAAPKAAAAMPVAPKPAASKAAASKPAAIKPVGKQASKPATIPKKAPVPAKVTSIAKKTAGRAQSTGTLIESIEPYQEAPGEDYMNDAQREHFRSILLAWKRELMEEVDRTVHHMQDEAANFPDPNDRATQESEFSMELRTRDRERKLIKKIDETISKLDHDEYGYCESCGVEIGIRRLEARPTAAL
ncbi:MAG TPA: RNA polymerase-binding protein DksA, partial [Gammaproteobacteria bacterium]